MNVGQVQSFAEGARTDQTRLVELYNTYVQSEHKSLQSKAEHSKHAEADNSARRKAERVYIEYSKLVPTMHDATLALFGRHGSGPDDIIGS